MNKQCVAQLLRDIESALKQLALWQAAAPSLEQFASEQPFFMDKMAPHEWLQWVLLPNLAYLMDQNQLPAHALVITPYFEMAWQGLNDPHYQRLLQLLARLDSEFSDQTI